MEKITSISELKTAIQLLEIKKVKEMMLLKEQFNDTLISLKPSNLIKNKITDIVESPNLKKNIFSTALGLVAGYLSKKVMVGSTHNPIKQVLGTLLQVGITGLVAKNSDGIQSIASQLTSKFFKNKNQIN